MAHSLTPQDVKLLDQTRQRLSQLTNSLTSLQNTLLSSNPLPPYSSLHSQTLILGQTLASLAAHLHSHSSAASNAAGSGPLTKPSTLQLPSTAVYPLPQYPGREEEGLLGQLLRKKLEVGVEEWVEQGREAGEQVTMSLAGSDEWRALWEWAGIAANGVAREYDWGGDLDDDDDDEEEEEKEKDDAFEGAEDKQSGQETGKNGFDEKAAGKPMSMDDVMRFMARGEDIQR